MSKGKTNGPRGQRYKRENRAKNRAHLAVAHAVRCYRARPKGARQVNRYTLLCMAAAALLGSKAGTGPAFGLLAGWAFAMVWHDMDMHWGNKTIGQLLQERKERK